MRPSGREATELRALRFRTDYTIHAEGSVLAEFGNTRVLCTASVEDRVPGWMRNTGRGWVTAEYGMLPRSTHTRSGREASRGKQGGRTLEIQRLIGRSLRAVTDLEALGERSVTLDCDVIQADGGTRTAAISGAFVALSQALAGLRQAGQPAPHDVGHRVAGADDARVREPVGGATAIPDGVDQTGLAHDCQVLRRVGLADVERGRDPSDLCAAQGARRDVGRNAPLRSNRR